jgi:UDP-N-acetylmuramoyl-tripeptide--D-alanyl-D-alanine ligase
VEAALLALAEFPASRRRVAVLGDMLELGRTSEVFHSQVGKRVAEQATDLLVTVGPLAKDISEAARAEGLPVSHAIHFDDSVACAAMVAAWSRPGDTILLKGSRGVALERVVDALVKHYQKRREEN